MENNDAGLTPPVSKQEDRYDKFKRAEFQWVCFFRKKNSAIIANMEATPSAMGILIQTPFAPKNSGRISNKGIRNSICLVRVRNIDK